MKNCASRRDVGIIGFIPASVCQKIVRYRGKRGILRKDQNPEKPKCPDGKMTQHTCYGLRSKLPTAVGQHIVLVDIDEYTMDQIRSQLTMVQGRHDLSDWIILKNPEKETSFHCHNPTKISYQEYVQLLNELSIVDENFKHPLTHWKNKTTILRVHSPTKGRMEPHTIIFSDDPNRRECSRAHLMFLHCMFGLDISRYTNVDANLELTFDRYYTQKI